MLGTDRMAALGHRENDLLGLRHASRVRTSRPPVACSPSLRTAREAVSGSDMTAVPATTSDPQSRWHCPTCGSWMAWNPAKHELACASCGATAAIDVTPGETTHAFVQQPPALDLGSDPAYECHSCGAQPKRAPSQIAGRCVYCNAPYVLTALRAPNCPPDGVIPSSVDVGAAQAAVHRWVQSRRFAPSAFKHAASAPQITLTYHPLWSFDALTTTAYAGERGIDHEVGGGRNQAPHSETEWRPVSGTLQRAFVREATPAAPAVAPKEQWDFSALDEYQDDFLVGSSAFAATQPVADGWIAAMQQMCAALTQDVRRQIGGDHQRIEQLETSYANTAFAYVMAPDWAGSYTFKDKSFSLEVNAETGRVGGSRPYSAIKIAAAVAVLLLVVVILVLYAVWTQST